MELADYTQQPGTLEVAKHRLSSKSDGPGNSLAVWVRGCPFRCRGCSQADLQQPSEVMAPNEAWDMHAWNIKIQRALNHKDAIDGISLMGGEPMAHARALAPILENIRDRYPDLYILVFSGYTYEQLLSFKDEYVNRVLACIDTLIDGQFIPSKFDPNRIAGSTNQRIIHLTNKLEGQSFERVGFAEYSVASSGMTKSGYGSADILALSQH